MNILSLEVGVVVSVLILLNRGCLEQGPSPGSLLGKHFERFNQMPRSNTGKFAVCMDSLTMHDSAFNSRAHFANFTNAQK